MNASGEESASTLHNLMKLVDDLSYNHNFAANYITDADIGNRNDAVRWMQHVSFIYFAVAHKCLWYNIILLVYSSVWKSCWMVTVP